MGAEFLESERGGFEPPVRLRAQRFSRPPPDSTTAEIDNTCDGTSDGLGSCLAILDENDPELAAIVRAWPDLPDAVRAGILAMIEAS